MGWEFTIKKSDEVRVNHEKIPLSESSPSEKERSGESSQ